MDESAKLSALQKAYAEIIMNVSNEAASRVLASEKKRSRLQQELSDVKDEGLRMLLRLKQMLDDKSNEAESTSIIQRRRIDELEAQLDEANDIEKELKGELREAQAELAKVRSCRSNSSNRNSTGPDTASTEPIEGNEVEASKSYSHNAHVYAHNRDFSTRTMEPKEIELHRDLFTQKIQAFGAKLYGELSLPREDDHLRNEVRQRGGKGDAFCLISNLSPDQPFGMEEDPDELEVTETDGNHLHLEVPKSFPRKGKRTTRYRKGKIPLQPEVRRASNSSSGESSMEPHHVRILASDTEQIAMRCLNIRSHIGLVRPCSFRDTKDNSKSLIAAAVEAVTSPAGRSDIRRLNDLPSHVEVSNLADPVMEDRYNGKFLKYTFQRRRKKGNLSFPEGISTADQSTPKMEIDDDRNNSQESDVLDLMNESSGDMQLMEVAKQISSPRG